MLVEQIGAHGHPILRQRLEGAGAQCAAGRDLGCDIVVDDEHAAPRHVLLTLLEDGRVKVRDLGTRNGTRIDGNRLPPDSSAIIEQGEIMVGRTRLRVRTRHTPIGPERVVHRNFLRKHRTLLAAAGVSACIAYGAFLQWLDAPASLFRGVTMVALVVLGSLALWTGLWALTTKLNQGSWHVRVHLAIASIGAVSCALAYWLAGLMAFAAQESALVQAGIAAAGAMALAALYMHLREATHYGRRVSLALACVATLVIGAIAWIVAIGVDDSDVNRVALGPEVRLGADRIVPNRDIADYLAEVEKLQRAAGRARQRSLLEDPLPDADD
nr:A26 [uncultured bacterium]